MLANNTSTASNERLSADSALDTNRLAPLALSASATCRAFKMRVTATATTASTNDATPPHTKSLMRRGTATFMGLWGP